jgi:hypothetical protein
VPQLAVADPPTLPRRSEPIVTAPRLDPHDTSRVPGVTGDAAGIVIAPPTDFKDGRDYPLGMVMRPPNIHDDGIWIAPDQLRSSVRRFGLHLQDAIGELGKLFEQH